jgi:very-short-patch-repair endonuclease
MKNKKELKKMRSTLRANMPAPEIVLWQKIRGNALGVKFRRQLSIENSILDFYSPNEKLDIEIDGDSHYLNKAAIQKDKLRDLELGRIGIKVLRFTNREVMTNLDGVVLRIMEVLRTPSQSPPILSTKQWEKI